MAKILIIDDETYAVANLLGKVESYRPDDDIRTSTSPLAAISMIEEWKPDIVFLDITMPGLNGFELLDQLPQHAKKFSLIFCTAHDEFALDAFDQSAIDYIVKPIDMQRLKKAIDKAELVSEKIWDKHIRNTLDSHQHKVVGRKSDQKYIFIAENIHFFTSQHHETIFLDEGKEYFCDLSLSELETQLDPKVFFRSHRSFLINLTKVHSLCEKENTIQFLGSDQKAQVSKRMKAVLKRKLFN